MIQVEQAAQLEADERGAEVGGNAEQVEEEEVYGGGGTVWHVLYKRLNYMFWHHIDIYIRARWEWY